MNSTFFFQICLLLSLFSCQINGQQHSVEKSDNELPTRRELANPLWELKSATVVYPDESQLFTSEDIATIKRLESEEERFKITAIPANKLTEKDLREKIIVLVGTPKSNEWIAKLLPQLPFEISENWLSFDGQKFTDSSTVFKLPFYPNPLNPKLPLQITTGLNNVAVVDYINDFLENEQYFFEWSSWGYELFQRQQRIIFGNFSDREWQYDKKVHFDFTILPDSMPTTKHFEFLEQTTLNKAQAAMLRQKCEANVAEIRAFLNTEKEIPIIKYCLYRSAEEKGLMIGNTDQSNVQFSKNRVHTVLNETYSNNFIGKENELLLRQLLGEPKTLALERGFAIFFTENWQRKGYKYWAKKMSDSENILPLSDILNEEKGSKSRYLNGCLSASFVEFLIAEFGKEAFLKSYSTKTFSKEEIPNLEKKWHTYLKAQPATRNPQPVTGNSQQLPYLKGFNFAHEGYQIYNGYISREAANAIDKEVSLGANANAIVPYSFMRDPRKAATIPVSEFAGGENDESIVHAAQASRNRGMTVVLKPQVWLGGGSWPGEVEMKNEEDWQLWFNNYYEWILHYAMMAEIHEMDVLCIGTEFVQATLQRPDDWRKIIKKLRGIYSGKLTYAANWGDEFEKMIFWEDLDYIGLNCYYPLSKNNNASNKELKAGFQEVVEKIERVYKKEKKRIIFTEIGFRSVAMPWLNPHAEPDRAFNEAHQKRCYETVFAGIENQPWCQGILWWKFPSYLGHRGQENTGYSPYNKSVEATIKKYFQRD